MTMLVPDTIELRPIEVEGVRTVRYDPRRPIPAEHRDADVLVVWGNPQPLLEDAAATMPRLRWVQTLGAGPEATVAAGFAADVLITSGRTLHAVPVAEHALALLLAGARRLHDLRDAQTRGRWVAHLGGMQPLRDASAFRSLIGAHVVIWGFGSIAERLAGYLIPMEARVTGIARSAGERAGVPVVGPEGIDDALASADALVMILPSLPSTQMILDATRLALLPQHAWSVNVGRGVTVDEDALVAALRDGALAGAALDVFATEPLPSDSPLWTLPQVIISPHAAGGRPMGAESLLEENLRHLQSGRPLRNLVERG